MEGGSEGYFREDLPSFTPSASMTVAKPRPYNPETISPT